jgi:hypothetical protein
VRGFSASLSAWSVPVTAGAEIRVANGWALMGKFDGEFGRGTQTYVGTGRVRYAW